MDKNNFTLGNFEYNKYMNENQERNVEVTFYKYPNGERWISKGRQNSIPWAEILHPTRLTIDEWNKILETPYSKVQEILSNFF